MNTKYHVLVQKLFLGYIQRISRNVIALERETYFFKVALELYFFLTALESQNFMVISRHEIVSLCIQLFSCQQVFIYNSKRNPVEFYQ